jgi:hypothetical protein
MIQSRFSLVPFQLTQSPDGYMFTALTALPALESSNKVWQRVEAALAGATPGAKLQFKQFKQWLATQKGNLNLRYTTLNRDATSGTTGAEPHGLTTASTGAMIGTGVTTIYAIYLAKSSGATSYFVLVDEASDAALSGLTASVRLTLASITAGTSAAPSETVYIRPAGLPMANGVRAASVTTPQGVTIAANTASDNGFIISA